MATDPARKFTITYLLRPHTRALTFGLLAVIGEGIANLLEPWPLKIVLDNVVRDKHTGGWLNHLIVSLAGADRFAVLKFAAIAVLVIAVVDAVCSYTEKYLTTSVGQWVMHDLRQMLYSHIQRLSLAYHDQKQTGDLISRVTSDIDAIQSFIASGLLGVIVNSLTLVGMVGVMFYINWRFTLIALSVAPPLFVVVYRYTRRIKKASREVRKKEGEIVSVIQEVLSSIRVVKAFGREEYEERRLEEESLESVEAALQARGLKAKLSPLVDIIVAVGTALVLWLGARMVLDRHAFQRLADRLHHVSRQDVQAHAGAFEDDRCLVESRGRLRAHSRSAGDQPRGAGSSGRLRAPPSRARSNSTTSLSATSPDTPDSQRCQPAGRARTGGGAGGTDRRRQDHHHQPDSALLRSRHGSR